MRVMNLFLAIMCLIGYLLLLGVVIGGVFLLADRITARWRREREQAAVLHVGASPDGRDDSHGKYTDSASQPERAGANPVQS